LGRPQPFLNVSLLKKLMRHFLITALATVVFITISTAQVKNNIRVRKQIKVEVNPNIELLGFAYFLGYQGKEVEKHDSTFVVYGRKTNGKEWFAFDWKIYQEYKSHTDSKNIDNIITMANKIWLDYLINLIIQLDNFPNAELKNVEPKYYSRFSDNWDIAEAKANASSFIKSLNKLYLEVKFNHFLKKYQSYYNIAVNEVRKGLSDDRFVPAMENFYGVKFNSYHLIPSLTIPPTMGFGIKYSKANKITINNVFGPLGFQDIKEGKPLDLGFKDKEKIRELSTHEFGHSFVNPIIDSIPNTLIEQSRRLFDDIKVPMGNQGYSQWKVCLYEHFVRAGEIMIARNLGYKEEANKLLKEYIDIRRFIYLPIILTELEKYNIPNNESYKQAVMNVLVKFSQMK
jgi:hypothetical protein